MHAHVYVYLCACVYVRMRAEMVTQVQKYMKAAKDNAPGAGLSAGECNPYVYQINFIALDRGKIILAKSAPPTALAHIIGV